MPAALALAGPTEEGGWDGRREERTVFLVERGDREGDSALLAYTILLGTT